jgi:hypothetical protein
VKGTPARIVALEFAAAGHPTLARLRIGKKTLVDEQILMRQRRQRLAQLDDRLQQLPFGFLAVALKRGRRVGHTYKPRAARPRDRHPRRSGDGRPRG